MSDREGRAAERRSTEGDSESPADVAAGQPAADEERPASGTDGPLEAALWSPDSAADPDVRITVYVVTGRHGRLRVPERFCRECHLFTRAADAAAERVEADIAVDVVSWWTRLPWALRHGGYHPPVMVVGGSRLCQGHEVPTPEEVTAAIGAALE